MSECLRVRVEATDLRLLRMTEESEETLATRRTAEWTEAERMWGNEAPGRMPRV